MLTSKLFQYVFGRINYDPSKDKHNTDTWPLHHEKEEWFIESEDHLQLGAWLYRNASDIFVIFVHGYHTDLSTQGAACRLLHDELGWNVLLISPRATGISEGNYNTMGEEERYDIVRWIKELVRREPSAKIVLHGWSMGATSVMGALGEELPKNVICAICDSGYADIAEQIRCTMKKRYPMLPMAAHILNELDHFCRKKYDFTINYTVEEGLQLNHIPVLFIHGGKDKLVPVSNVNRCFKANAGEKQLMIIPNAGHCSSLSWAHDQYLLACAAIVRTHI